MEAITRILTWKRYTGAIIIIGLIVSSSLLIYNVFFNKSKGVKIRVIVDKSASSYLLISNYEIYAEIKAIDPIDPNVSVTVLSGFINNSEIILNPAKNAKFKKVLDDWTSRLGRAELFKYFETYLLVSLWIISPDEDYRIMPDKAINYNPFKAKKELISKNIVIKSNELVEVPKNASKLFILGEKFKLKQLGGYYTTYEWEVNYQYSVFFNEYKKVPIAIAYNPETDSAPIETDITVEKDINARFRVTIGYGLNIIENLGSVTLDLYSLDVGLSSKSTFSDCITLGYGFYNKGWIYIKAKPALFFEEEYQYLWYRDYNGRSHLISKTKTGEERIRVEIVDIEWYFKGGKKYIRGGIEIGNYPDYQADPSEKDFADWFFSGITVKAPPIDDYILDPVLDETESKIYLDTIVEGYDEGHNSLGVGIPVGAMIAAIAPELPFLGLLAPLIVSFGYDVGTAVRIHGKLINKAFESSTEKDDFSEKVYVGVNNYIYKFGVAELEVPSGIYFEYRTFNIGDQFGGCPILYVFNGSMFVEEGLLNIHSVSDSDAVLNHTLRNIPVAVDDYYAFRLVEHNLTYSYIDKVSLFAVLNNGSLVELPLVYAQHSVYGDVLRYLAESDDLYTITLGSDIRGGDSHFIDLRFDVLDGNLDVLAFIFQIEGHNWVPK